MALIPGPRHTGSPKGKSNFWDWLWAVVYAVVAGIAAAGQVVLDGVMTGLFYLGQLLMAIVPYLMNNRWVIWAMAASFVGGVLVQIFRNNQPKNTNLNGFGQFGGMGGGMGGGFGMGGGMGGGFGSGGFGAQPPPVGPVPQPLPPVVDTTNAPPSIDVTQLPPVGTQDPFANS